MDKDNLKEVFKIIFNKSVSTIEKKALEDGTFELLLDSNEQQNAQQATVELPTTSTDLKDIFNSNFKGTLSSIDKRNLGDGTFELSLNLNPTNNVASTSDWDIAYWDKPASPTRRPYVHYGMPKPVEAILAPIFEDAGEDTTKYDPFTQSNLGRAIKMLAGKKFRDLPFSIGRPVRRITIKELTKRFGHLEHLKKQ